MLIHFFSSFVIIKINFFFLTLLISTFANQQFDIRIFQTSFKLPLLSSGQLKCHPRILSMANQIRMLYGNQSLDYLNEKYIQFGRHLKDNMSIENLHFLFSTLLSATINQSCINFPPRFRTQILPFIQVKEYISGLKSFNFHGRQLSEVFYFHHGLRFADPRILKYIENRDIMDIGAYNGDSAFIFQNYTSKQIFSYEFNPDNVNAFLSNQVTFKMNPKKVILINKGISNIKENISVSPCDLAASCAINKSQGQNNLQLTTIDDEVIEHGIKLGFLKADIEGSSFQLVQGALLTFTKHRPVFALSIYHSYDEVFKVPEILMNYLSNYAFELHLESPILSTLGEMVLFGFPFELIN